MLAKRSDFVVDLKTAYDIAKDFFLENNYSGVFEIRESKNNWLFEGKCDSVQYGSSEVCVPKNGDEPYLFSIRMKDGFEMWKNAKEVNYDA